MSYLAIARKYRPATFDEIVGQEHVSRTLKNAIARGRIHHAFLFSGARGVGKTTAARALARALNCVNGPTADPCGTCGSCVEVTQGNSPDLIEIDGASNNSVDDVRDLRETVRYAPTRGKWKIYLIDEVHMLSKGAFNALLKTLEEPPPHVVFIFATTEAQKIPETILSRVQRFEFKRIPVPGVAQRLREIADRESVTLSDNALRIIARAGEGSMRDAQSLLDQVISYAAQPDASGQAVVSDEDVVEALGLIDRSLLYDMLEGLVTGAPDRCLEVIERVYGYGYELSEFTGEMLEVLRNAAFVRLSPAARRYVDIAPDELERLDRVTREVEPETLTRTFTAMLDVHDQVSRASRPRIVLEMAVARLATTRPLQPVGQLLGRLEDLERRLRQGGAGASIGGMRAPRAPRPPRAAPPGPGDDDGPPAPVAERPAPRPAERAKPSAERAQPSPPERPKAERTIDRRVETRDVTPSMFGAPAQPPAAAVDASNAPAEDEPVDPWAAFAADLRAIGGGIARIAEGEAKLLDGKLRVVVTARALAEARRDDRPELAAALARHYPEGTALDLVAGAARESLREEDLLHEVKQDPAFRRVIERLGAQVEKVTPLKEPRDGGGSEEA